MRHTRQHELFIGCANFPACRYTCAYELALQRLASQHDICKAEVRRLQLEVSRLQAEVLRLELANKRLSAEVYRSELARQDLAGRLARLSLPAHTRARHNPELTRALTHIIATAHPDRWAQGQPATELAHVLTLELLKLRAQLQGGLRA